MSVVVVLRLACLVASVGEFCITGSGEQGVCLDTAVCAPTGVSYPGFCPGPVNIQVGGMMGCTVHVNRNKRTVCL